jgi:LacI family transcriptional regulator
MVNQTTMITIKDIAKKLDISVSTVGRALTDHPRISQETKERVLAAAKELGYVANAPARMMRGGSSHLVGLLVPNVRSTFYSMAAQTLSDCLARDNFHLTLSLTDDEREVELEQLRELISARVAGVIVVPSAAPRRETVTLLKTVPHAQLLRRVPSLGDWFGIDDDGAARRATAHLLKLGHRRIGFVGDTIFPTGRARLEGFRGAHLTENMPVYEELVALGPPTAEFAAGAIDRFLGLPDPPTAVAMSSVLATVGAAERLADLEVPVPQQLSIVGFGDDAWCKWWGPGLTTVRLPVEDLATLCGLWLVHRLKSLAHGSETPHLAVSAATLVVRGSTRRLDLS